MALYLWRPSSWYADRSSEWPLRQGWFDDVWRIARQVEDIDRALFSSPNYVRPRGGSSSGGVSSVINDDKKFQVTLDVTHFKPEELEVSTKDNRLMVHGKHEEKDDEHGSVKREFTRVYWIPKGADAEKFKSNLTTEGVLTIEAPKVAEAEAEEHKIPIESAEK